MSGCPFRCEGCIVEELQNPNVGAEYKDFYEVITPFLSEINGITFSGGEPLAQAKELYELLKKLPKNLDKMLFTGYYKEELNQIQKKCFNMFDLVVEGRFENDKKGNFLYRGSSNQIFSSPTNKYNQKFLDELYKKPSAGLEIEVTQNELLFYGIPTDNEEIELIKDNLQQIAIIK